MSRYYPIVPLFCGLLLTGCAKIPDKVGLYQEPPSPWVIEQKNACLRSVEPFIHTANSINIAELTPALLQ